MTGEERTLSELLENKLYLSWIDRMLKEKYGEIEYLAIMPKKDPNIMEINKPDLDWLLSEHEKADRMETEQTEQKNEYERRLLEWENNYGILESRYTDLESQNKNLERQLKEVLQSWSWRIGHCIGRFFGFLTSPFRKTER